MRLKLVPYLVNETEQSSGLSYIYLKAAEKDIALEHQGNRM